MLSHLASCRGWTGFSAPLFVVACLSFLLPTTHAFAPRLPARTTAAAHQQRTLPRKQATGVPEYTEIEEDEQEVTNSKSSTTSAEGPEIVVDDDMVPAPLHLSLDDSIDDETPSVSVASTRQTSERPRASNNNNNQKSTIQYAALEPGTVVQIQIGDPSAARKAWKKRRRNASPLLVPCSVLSTDRTAQIRWNLIYLLHKFGAVGARNNKSRVRLAVAELAQRHRSHLKSSLQAHAAAAGCAGTQQFVEEVLWDAAAQKAYGVQLVPEEDENGTTTTHYLEAPLSRSRAQKMASAAAILQFAAVDSDSGAAGVLQHTGLVRNRRRPQEGSNADDNGGSHSSSNYYQLQPLSAALRVSQPDVSQIAPGAQCAAVVFEYDPQGDAGAPLLTLTLNPSRNRVRDRLQLKQQQQRHKAVERDVRELAIGDALSGLIVRLVKGGALVDCGVGRNGASVLGLLRFKDTVNNDDDNNNQEPAVTNAASLGVEDKDDDDDDGDGDGEDEEEEDWDEILSLDDLDLDEEDDKNDDEDENEESSSDPVEAIISKIESTDDEFENSDDITHLFKQNDDGSLTYTDPESGTVQVISSDADDEDEDEDRPQPFFEKASIKKFGYAEFEKAVGTPDPLLAPTYRTYPTKLLRIGDRINVFVKSVSKQSNQFALTMDSSVKGKKAKEIKREGAKDKKKFRLAKQLGGFRRIRALKGKECDGTIKATSNTGDWYYVQPDLENLPVGVATVTNSISDPLKQGDNVRIRLEGVDKDRGQLAICILKKLSP